MKILFIIFFNFCVLNVFASGDIEAGKSVANRCAACHGQDGWSVNPAWPSLAGQNTMYLSAQLNKFKSGERKDAIMAPLAKSLSDKEIADVSSYYNSLNSK